MLWRLAASLAVIAVMSVASEAATLRVQGAAWVDKGYGMAPAADGTEVAPGNRVRGERGCAQIIYANGYVTKVCAGQSAVVLAKPPGDRMAGSMKDTPADCTVDCSGTTTLLMGGALVAGATVAIIELSRDSKPASP